MGVARLYTEAMPGRLPVIYLQLVRPERTNIKNKIFGICDYGVHIIKIVSSAKALKIFWSAVNQSLLVLGRTFHPASVLFPWVPHRVLVYSRYVP